MRSRDQPYIPDTRVNCGLTAVARRPAEAFVRFEVFIALRYLFARRKQSFIFLISMMSILGVGLGVGALVVVFGVYNGFTSEIRDKILGANAHITVTGSRLSLVEQSGSVQETLARTPGVAGVTPFIYAEGMLSSPSRVKGVILRGIDPVTAPDVLKLFANMDQGSLSYLPEVPGDPDRELPGVIVGRELAKLLGLTVGSRVNLLSPAGQKNATGFAPRIRPFRVAGVFHSGMIEYDSSLALVTLQAARDVFGLPDGAISGFEVTVPDVYKAGTIAAIINERLGRGYLARSWMELNANLFAALELERLGMFIVLAMIVLVGSFSIVTSLVMLVMEKTRDIAVLMSMGATRAMVRRIFIIQGMLIGLAGTTLGYAGGISLSLLLQKYKFIKLPQGVYVMDHLPVLLRWEDIATIGVSALVLCFLATIYPARQAAGLQPAEALRYE